MLEKVLPPVWLLLAVLLMVGLDWWCPVMVVVPGPWHWMGLVPLAVGLLISGQSNQQFMRAGTAVRPFERSRALVTEGWFQYTRNPMYLGLVLILLGLAVLLGTLTVYLPVIGFFIILDRGFIRVEEQQLAKQFPHEYAVYRRRVRRWL